MAPASISSCVFCRIVAKEAPASVLGENEVALAFLDLHPVNPGHALVVPKAHAATLQDLDPETGGRVFALSMAVAAALRKSGLRCEGVNLHLADGEIAGQEIFHVHLHVVPRFGGDGFGLRVPPTYPGRPSREELDRIAERIRAALRFVSSS